MTKNELIESVAWLDSEIEKLDCMREYFPVTEESLLKQAISHLYIAREGLSKEIRNQEDCMRDIATVIKENPGVPIIVDICDESYGEAVYVRAQGAEVKEVLIHHTYSAFDDPDELREEVENDVAGIYAQLGKDLTDEELEKEVDEKMEALKPYWQKVIVIHTGGEWI